MYEISPAVIYEVLVDDVDAGIEESRDIVVVWVHIGFKKVVAYFARDRHFDRNTLIDQVITKYYPELDNQEV